MANCPILSNQIFQICIPQTAKSGLASQVISTGSMSVDVCSAGSTWGQFPSPCRGQEGNG